MLTIIQTEEENIQSNNHNKRVLNKLVTKIQLVKGISVKRLWLATRAWVGQSLSLKINQTLADPYLLCFSLVFFSCL